MKGKSSVLLWLTLFFKASQHKATCFTPSSIEPFGEGAGAHGREIWICTISVGMFLQLEEKNILGFDLKNLTSFEVSILWGISNVPYKEKSIQPRTLSHPGVDKKNLFY